MVISLNTDVSDGGIDARIDAEIETDSLLVQGLSFFQIKAGQSFKPWQKANLRRELFGKSTTEPSKKVLAPAILECLELGGRYLLVSFGHDFTPSQHSSAKAELTKLFKACGYHDPEIDVLGQGQLLGLISSFPSLALQLLSRDSLSFLDIAAWQDRSDMTNELQLAEPQQELIEKIRSTLRMTDHQHVRVVGEPGIGKTRLILEALSVNDLASLVIYSPHAEDFQRSQVFNELLRPDVEYHVITVIDECNERERASI